ncbi:MAG TPA: DUF3078 domain-containing protein [Bacteroidota bacterium]|jgi:hypothetical protein
MKRLALGVLILWAGTLCAQAPDSTPAPPPPVYGMKNSLVAGLTLTQIAFTDWAQGGENALSYSLSADGKAEDDELGTNWTTLYKFAFGQTRLGDQGLRKTDDIIDLSTVFTYKIDKYLNPYAAASFKSQFAKGYAYKSDGTSTEVSNFFDPAYLLQSAGVGYEPSKQFRTRLGVGLREVITSNFNQYTDDPATTEIEKNTVDGGLESVTNIEFQLAENILFTTQLELFDPFKHLDVVVVRSTTGITGKVNKYVTAIFGLQLINEQRVSPRTQVKEAIAIGLSYTLF